MFSVWCFGVPSVYSIALLYPWLFGYTKHDLNIYSCFEKNSLGLGPSTHKHASWRAGDKPSQLVMSALSAPFTRSDAASDERTDEAVVFV